MVGVKKSCFLLWLFEFKVSIFETEAHTGFPSFHFLVVLSSVFAALIGDLWYLSVCLHFKGFWVFFVFFLFNVELSGSLLAMFPFTVFPGLICRLFVSSPPSGAPPLPFIILICFPFMCLSNYLPFVRSLLCVLYVLSLHVALVITLV